MNEGQRQIIAEKVSSTVRVLELLGFDYEVSAQKTEDKKGINHPAWFMPTSVSQNGSEFTTAFAVIPGQINQMADRFRK